jgi:hypothetical protein
MFLNNKKKKLLSNTFVTLLSVLLLLSSFKSNHIFSNYELICSQFKSYFVETNSDSKEKLNNSLHCKKCINNFSLEKKLLFLNFSFIILLPFLFVFTYFSNTFLFVKSNYSFILYQPQAPPLKIHS